MKSVNKVFLLGHVGSTPEMKFSQSGVAVSKFSLATNEKYKDKSGEWQEKTEWSNCVAWAKLAEFVQQYVMKGSKIHVEGRLQTSSWQDKSTGENKYRTEIIVSDLILLDNKSDKEQTKIEEDPIPF